MGLIDGRVYGIAKIPDEPLVHPPGGYKQANIDKVFELTGMRFNIEGLKIKPSDNGFDRYVTGTVDIDGCSALFIEENYTSAPLAYDEPTKEKDK